MADSGNKRKWSIGLFIAVLGLIPFVLWFGSELGRGGTIWYFRVNDLADFLIMAPIYIGVLTYLFYHMAKSKASTKLLLVFLAFIYLFVYGHAMHFTGNSINTYSTEVQNYKEIIPPDTYALIFFLDERLSHFLLFVAATGLICMWFIFDRAKLAPPLLPDNRFLIFALGIVYGFLTGFSLIEARMVIMAIPMVLVMTGLWLWYWRRSGLSLGAYFSDRPFTTMVIIVAISTVVMMGGWGIYFDGFPQPSEFTH